MEFNEDWLKKKIKDLENQSEDIDDTVKMLKQQLKRQKGIKEDTDNTQQLLQE